MPINEKLRPALPCRTDQEKTLTKSIPHLTIEMEPLPPRDPIGIDSFSGRNRSFRSYLKARKIFIAVGIIV